jgi:hypothetical protein
VSTTAPLDLLRRSDKLSLGGGRRCLWAPEFPRWADRLGFWDHAQYLEHDVEPLFTAALLDDDGRPVTLALAGRGWSPARLSQLYRAQPGLPDPAAFPAPTPAAGANLRVQEDKALSPEDAFLASLQFTNLLPHPQKLTLVLWTAQPRGAAAGGLGIDLEPFDGGAFALTRRFAGSGDRSQLEIGLAVGADLPPASFAALHSEWSTGHANHPRWDLAPFAEQAQLAAGHVRLPNVLKLIGGPWSNADHTLLYLALAYPLELAEGETARLTLACALAPSAAEARANLVQALDSGPASREAEEGVAAPTAPLRRVEQGWRDYFDAVPTFDCSNPYLEKYYYYRFFGLRLNTVEAGSRYNLPRPAVFEGINPGWFRHHISYSAQVHMREARWLPHPALAQGALENFVAAQRPDGSFPGAIMTGPGTSVTPGFMYHVDWGSAVRALHAVHPDPDFLRRVYPALLRYAAYLRREHDREGLHLFDVRVQEETGQELMPRYQFVDPEADRSKLLEPRLKGVDATVYAYNLFRCLEWLAPRLGEALPDEVAGEAGAIAAAVRAQMWDSDVGFFFDLNAATGQRSPAKAAIGFYPFLTDIPGPEHLRAFDHLFNPAEFWTPCPLPATSLDDPGFSAAGEWKDRRHICPWNGRAWLMATSHVAQALAQTAQRLAAEEATAAQGQSLAARAAELITRWVRCLYLDGDLARPTSFEYYHPLTGAAPFFRATDDYMHSWIADLLVQFVAGLQPADDGRLVVDPLPFGLDRFSIAPVRVQGHRVGVAWQAGQGLTVRVNGREAAWRADPGRLTLSLA